ncbi:hypothetical protein NXV15_24115 [Bacteroides thetaiotaomicron]|nr:hypothetical protein [Bacteroides thetaiotaomicron]
MNMYAVSMKVSNKLKKYASFGQTEQERLEAEMRFFRGYLYTDLVKRYKEVIIYDEDLDNIKKDMPVSSEAEGWNFVYEDLKFAGEHLPVDKTPNGRLTSGSSLCNAVTGNALCRKMG